MLSGSVLVLMSVILFLLTLIGVKRSREIELKILCALSCYDEMYDLQIAYVIEQNFGRSSGWEVLDPGLRRLERQGFVTARWDNERPAETGGAQRRYYRRTSKRKNLVDRESADLWWDFSQISNHNLMAIVASDEHLRQAQAKAFKEILKMIE
jgi:DNA-binding PadR family transcriptional regulator